MPDAPDRPPQNTELRRYRWPLFVIAALVLAVILAVLWLSVEIRRTQRIRDINTFQSRP